MNHKMKQTSLRDRVKVGHLMQGAFLSHFRFLPVLDSRLRSLNLELKSNSYSVIYVNLIERATIFSSCIINTLKFIKKIKK